MFTNKYYGVVKDSINIGLQNTNYSNGHICFIQLNTLILFTYGTYNSILINQKNEYTILYHSKSTKPLLFGKPYVATVVSLGKTVYHNF